MTHPHEDHGLDLIRVVESGAAIGSFWHSCTSLETFIAWSQQVQTYPSIVQPFVKKLHEKRPKFLTDLLAAVFERNIPMHKLQANIEPEVIDGVEIHCISPEETINNAFDAVYRERAQGKKAAWPNINLMSAILVLRFGDSVVVLGADALRDNWETAVRRFRNKNLPRAQLLKVPHHGAINAIILKPRASEVNYLDVCIKDHPHAVLFAGTNKHPEPSVFEILKQKTNLICLNNGLKNPKNARAANPLGLAIPGATAQTPADVCNLVVSYELTDQGQVNVIKGARCNFCTA